MKKISLILLLIICAQFTEAQETPSTLAPANFKTLSISTQCNFLNSRPYPLQFGSTSSTNFRGLGISLANHKVEQKKRKYKRLNALVFVDNTEGIVEDVKLNAFSLSIGIGRYLHLFDEERFRFKYGGGLAANYYFRETKAKQASVFNRTVHAGSLDLVFESQLEIQVIEKLHLFLGIDLKVFNFGFEISYLADPGLFERQRKNGGFVFSIKEDSLFKIGIGFKI